jgi:hypothetical protein
MFFTKITEKIEKVKQQPEYVRIRYVWGCVAASMFIVLIIWIFSIASMFKAGKNNLSQETNSNITDIKQQLQELQGGASSLKNISSQSLNAGTEGVGSTDQQGADNFQYPATGSSDSTDSAVPQSNTYSNLQNTNTPLAQ